MSENSVVGTDPDHPIAVMFHERVASRPNFGPKQVRGVSEITEGVEFLLHDTGGEREDVTPIRVLAEPYMNKQGSWWVLVKENSREHEIGLAYLGVTPYSDGWWSAQRWLERK